MPIRPPGVSTLIRLARLSRLVGCLQYPAPPTCGRLPSMDCPEHGTTNIHPSLSDWTAALPATLSARPKPSCSLRGAHSLLWLEISAAADTCFHKNSLTQRNFAVFQKQLSSKARTTHRTVGQLLLKRLRLQSVVRLRRGANERDFEPPSESPEKPKFRLPRSP